MLGSKIPEENAAFDKHKDVEDEDSDTYQEEEESEAQE